MNDWIKVDERLPDSQFLNQVEVIGYNLGWICADTNPLGQRICWCDSDGWNCARFSAYKEVYFNEEYPFNHIDAPTHWRPLHPLPYDDF